MLTVLSTVLLGVVSIVTAAFTVAATGTAPLALPKLTNMPRGARLFSDISKVSLPTLSYTTGTPAPPVSSRTRAGTSSSR